MNIKKIKLYSLSFSLLTTLAAPQILLSQTESPLRVSSPYLGQVFTLGSPVTLASKSIPPSPGNCEYKFDSTPGATYQALPEGPGPILGEDHEITLSNLAAGEYHFTIRCPNPATPDTSDTLTSSGLFKIIPPITAPAEGSPISSGETIVPEPAVKIISPTPTQALSDSGLNIIVKTLEALSCSYQLNRSGSDTYLVPDQPKLRHQATATGLRAGAQELVVACVSSTGSRKTASLNFNLVNSLGGPEIGSLTEENTTQTNHTETPASPSASKSCSLNQQSTSSAYQGLFFIISFLGLWFYRKREIK